MSEPTMETLARRLERLERRSRRLKWVIAILTVVMFAGFVFELWVLDRRLHLHQALDIDAASVRAYRVALKRLDDPLPALEFFTVRDGAFLSMVSPRGAIQLDTDTGLQVKLVHKKGGARAVLLLNKDGEPMLSLYDEEGRIRGVLGSVSLLKSRAGPGGSKVEVEEKIPAGLVFFDKNGKVIWSAP